MPRNRRQMLVQRVDAMRRTLDQIESMDEDSMLSGVPHSLRERMALGRLRPRLTVKRALEIVGSDLFTPLKTGRDSLLLEGGADTISSLSAAVGTHILWRNVLRLVQRTEFEALSEAVGVATREVAMRGRSREIAIGSEVFAGDLTDLAEEIRVEGALSWACWLAARDPVSARRLRLLTPSSIAQRVTSALPDDAVRREMRRSVVDIELDAMLDLARGDAETQEVA